MASSELLYAVPVGMLAGLFVGTVARWRGRPRWGPLGLAGPRVAFALFGAALLLLAVVAATALDAVVTPGRVGGVVPTVTALVVLAAGLGVLLLSAPQGDRARLLAGVDALVALCAVAFGLVAWWFDRAWGCGPVCF